MKAMNMARLPWLLRALGIFGLFFLPAPAGAGGLGISLGTITPASQACCSVTSVDGAAGIVKARIIATGQTFEFRPNDSRLLSTLKPGQAVYANFTSRQVSLDGRSACCAITAGPLLPAVKPPLSPTAKSSAGGAVGAAPSHVLNLAPNFGPVVPALGCRSGANGQPDLLLSSLSFNETRHITYIVENCGHAATQLPFVVDLYVNGTRMDTVEHQPLPSMSQQAVTSGLAQYQGCGQVQLRGVVDPQQIVAEANENNNLVLLQITPPCPDLAVDEIKQDWEDMNTRYTVQVKISNHGDGPSSIPVTVRAMHAGASGLGMPDMEDIQLPPLAPAQAHIFHLQGKHLASATTEVDILIDIYKQLLEKNRDNNVAHKTLGPH